MKMLWEKKAPAEASGSVDKKEKKKKKKKYEKQVWYGSPLDPEAFEVEEHNLKVAAAAERNTILQDLRALLAPPKSRLRLDPQKYLYFLHDPGRHVNCAITITNVRKSHIAFKFRTTSPHHCYMRPNGGILPPNESIVAIVSKYIEKYEPMKEQERKTKDKFKIISLPVEPDAEYYPDMFDDDEDNVVVERILRVIYIDPKTAPAEQVSKLQDQLAEAEAADAARKKALEEERESRREAEEEEIPQILAPGLVQEGQGQVINQWKKQREAFLALQLAGGVKSS